MATIPVPGSELRHVRKTITFTGGAGAGAIGIVTVFTITGRVGLLRLSARCTTTLTQAGATATIQLGTPGNINFFLFPTNSVNLLQNEWWMNSTPGAADSAYDVISAGVPGVFCTLSGNVIITCAGQATNSGTLIIDGWYSPITDDGALAGDDIDEPIRDHIWAKLMTDIAAVPTMTASVFSAINWLFALGRNKRTQTATTELVLKDDSATTLGTSTKSDDGVTFTRGKYS